MTFGYSDDLLQLLDTFQRFTSQHMDGKKPSNDFIAHCWRELLQAQWEILLDAEFLAAYVHGIVIECCDGIVHQFYPRILIYSADYKEKYVGCLRLKCFLFSSSTRLLLPASVI
jgi:hypothetical protein